MNTTLDLSELKSKIGQLFMAGMPGTALDKGTEALIREFNPGGIILFARNIADPVQLARLCLDLQSRSLEYHGTPLFLAVDQEGGRVARLREPFTSFPGNRAMGLDADPEERAREFGRITAHEMKLVGLNMNLAPVVDVQRGEVERHLEGRMFGEDPGVVARLGRRVVETLQENGVMAVAKHFPGLGRADMDPHIHLPRIDLEAAEIEAVNLPPFQAVIEAGVSGIMTSHAIYPVLEDRPATLSSRVLTRILREKLAFDGLIMTDDLEMGAIAEHWGVARGAADAFEAGADILLVCEVQGRVVEALNLILGKFLRGEISGTRIAQSNERIRKARSRFLDQETRISPQRVREYFNL
jgi:beta-N-acetylhexosaminidase